MAGIASYIVLYETQKTSGEHVTCRGGFIIQHVPRRSSESYFEATLDGPAYLEEFIS